MYWENVAISLDQDLNLIRECTKNYYYFYFSTKTYVMGTQKNRLNEMVLLSTQNMLILMGKKIMLNREMEPLSC